MDSALKETMQDSSPDMLDALGAVLARIHGRELPEATADEIAAMQADGADRAETMRRRLAEAGVYFDAGWNYVDEWPADLDRPES